MSAARSQLRTEHAQREAIRRLRGTAARTGITLPGEERVTDDTGEYAGLVTRAIGLALDSLIVNAAAALVGVTVGLGISLLHLPKQVDALIAAIMGGLWVLWSISYFVFFWSSTGQTPGDRVMRIKVIDIRGRGPLRPRRALVRFVGLCLAALPLLAGLLMMLWDDRRRCLQDRLARTVVVYVQASDQAATTG
jgi:uncharacterized RDD family membrane protein YckC